MHEQPAAEHQWLQKLVGNWTTETECVMGPDQPPMKSTGREVVRSLGGLWIVGEMTGFGPNDTDHVSLITLGYDPRRKHFVGTFVTSVMTYLWPYDGTLDAAGRKLTLNSEGPSFSSEGLARYQDIIEILDDNHYTLTSQVQGTDGAWQQFMTIHFHRDV